MVKKNAILILNYNGIFHLQYSIPNIISYINVDTDVIVVDNNSNDESLSYLEQFSELIIIKSKINLGYAGGNNLGLRYIINQGYKNVFIANNDILVCEHWINDSVNYLEKNKLIGCMGFNIFGEYTKVPQSDFEQAIKDYTQFSSKEVQNVPGMLILLKCEVLQRVGLFDEVMFMYGEEDDLEIRIKEVGYKIEKCNIPIWHYCEGTTAKYIPFKSSYLTYRNDLRSKIKFGTFRQFLYHSLAAFKVVLFNKFPVDITTNSLNRRRFPTRNRIKLLKIIFKAVSWNILNYKSTLKIRKREIYVRDNWNN